MSARDDFGSSSGTSGSYKGGAGGLGNGGVGGGAGGGIGGGGAGRNGGIGSKTGLTTGNVMKGGTQKGPAGGISEQLAEAYRRAAAAANPTMVNPRRTMPVTTPPPLPYTPPPLVIAPTPPPPQVVAPVDYTVTDEMLPGYQKGKKYYDRVPGSVSGVTYTPPMNRTYNGGAEDPRFQSGDPRGGGPR